MILQGLLLQKYLPYTPVEGWTLCTGLHKKRGGKHKTGGVSHSEGIVSHLYSMKTVICNNIDLTRQ